MPISEHKKEYLKQYYKDNKEKAREYAKQYYKDNKEKITERKEKWRLNRIKNGIDTPSMQKHYCWQWFGKPLKKLTPEERKIYIEKRRELKNNQK